MNLHSSHESWPLVLLGGFVGTGLAVGAHLLGDSWCGLGLILDGLIRVYHAVGIVLAGLVPLAIWAAKLLIDQLFLQKTDAVAGLDYSYISRTATLMGLLGTVISLGMATSQLAGEVTAGSSAAILKVIPLTGQALVSTMAGLIIAIIAETALHLSERKGLSHEPVNHSPEQ